MKKFEADCLESVYELATKEFSCSITDLEIEIIQQPSKGFLGFGRKSAIIEVCYKDSCKTYKDENIVKTFKKKEIHIEDVSQRIEHSNRPTTHKPKQHKPQETYHKKETSSINKKDRIFNNFYNEESSQSEISRIIIKKDTDEILTEIRNGITTLFEETCYGIDGIKIEMYDEETVYIEFSGVDSALLIGKEGYRYKALSYILFNWINEKYGLMLRLEVAEFLKNQEDAIHNYLEPVIEIIKEKGSFKTKPLDGILVHIALKKLRDEFPNKYVAVKTNVRGDKYVLVNEYRSKEV